MSKTSVLGRHHNSCDKLGVLKGEIYHKMCFILYYGSRISIYKHRLLSPKAG